MDKKLFILELDSYLAHGWYAFKIRSTLKQMDRDR